MGNTYIYKPLYSYTLMVIQIQISDKLWDYLNKEKKRGESFEDVLQKKLKLKKEVENVNKND